MSEMRHERPGVYSVYDASSVTSAGRAAKRIGVAALAVKGTANTAVTLTSYGAGVEAFGEDEPVATIQGPQNHVIELTRLYVTENAIADGLDFYGMRDFSLVICKPDRRVIYSGCHWSGIQESAQLGAMVAEKLTVIASKRVEVNA